MFYRKKTLVTFLITGCISCFSFLSSLAQNTDSTLISVLLNDIASSQVRVTGEFYPGQFPSYRECAGAPHNLKPDNNVFFTAISAFTLQRLLQRLNEPNRRIARQIIENARKSFPLYQSKNGLPFYNFWPTGKGIMPNSLFIKYFGKLLGISEDADDTVMVLMAEDATDSVCKLLKARMIEFSNMQQKKNRSSYRKYRRIPAYSTYLSSGMLPDFDLGVHCNILYFMLASKLPLVKQDSATIQLLANLIKDRGYIKDPLFHSPYYVRTPVLLYHISRLMGRFTIPELETLRPQLITDMQQLLNKTTAFMDRILLSTSLTWLGIQTPLLKTCNIDEFEMAGTNKFVFFQARAAFSYPAALKKIFLRWSYMHYDFYCPAYNKILWLEYLLERK